MRVLHVLVSMVLLPVCGCATAPKGVLMTNKPETELPSIQEEKSDVLSQIQPGMPLSRFQEILPEAYLCGQNGAVSAYELKHSQKYVTKGDVEWQNFWWGVGSPKARTYKQVLWFYFHENRLVKWGAPETWPTHEDLIAAPEDKAARNPSRAL